MGCDYLLIRRFDDKLDRIIQQNDDALSNQIAILTHQGIIMATMQQIRTNLADIRDVLAQYLTFLQGADAREAALRTEIEALIAASAISAADKAALQAEIDLAWDESEAVENAARAGLPGVPPVGGPPLLPSYDDRATFDAAVAAYTGPESVSLDGASVKTGTAGQLDYFTHADGSPSGQINTSGPTS